MITSKTPFEADILEQPAALRRLAASPLGGTPAAELVRDWDRIVFTGMGSSYFAGIPTWRALIGTGRATWSVDTGQLLDTPGLVTERTLLVVTSQSGASGEIVELVDRIAAGQLKPQLLVGVSNDESSALAVASQLYFPLESGPEATVSTKSYLNTLAVHRYISAAFLGESSAAVTDQVLITADSVERMIGEADLSTVATEALAIPGYRLAMVGRCDHGATALFAALITKESAKLPAEGFIGGQFRHGPFELAGDGLTAVIFGLDVTRPDPILRRLASDLVATGSSVVVVGHDELRGTVSVPAPGSFVLESLATAAVAAELLAVGLSRANGVVPGSFAYGSKITTAR
ncbi:SIS domain-containing protein [Leifsonia bigeumensis]|uniref:Glutamine--fructose-6-phosphate aminotransferase [isomerizing] n=1 Tax=Leifsonella bigeumensis TaxID=433643 RepID=A0ABP7FWM0_9MICO